MIATVRLAGTFVAAAAVALLVGVLLSAGAPALLGGRSFTVMSGSMTPAIRTGDIVADERVAPLETHVGDVVTFQDPHDPKRLITHRLRSIHVSGADALMVTKGDANNTVEHWSVPVTGRVGRVVYRVPKLGYALAAVRGPHGKLLLIVLPALLLGIFELVRIWRPTPPEPAVAAAAEQLP